MATVTIFKAYWALYLGITGSFREGHDQELENLLGQLKLLRLGGCV